MDDSLTVNIAVWINSAGLGLGPLPARGLRRSLWLRGLGRDPRQAETQGVPTDARVGRKELRPGEVLGESSQSHAETSPAEESQTQHRPDSVGQIAPGDNNVGSTPISIAKSALRLESEGLGSGA
jgi:hypothetical protein